MENKSLVLDMLQWINEQPRPYADVMDAWRTSCPRLTIWEDAVDAQLVTRRWDAALGSIVTVSEHGEALLIAERGIRNQ